MSSIVFETITRTVKLLVCVTQLSIKNLTEATIHTVNYIENEIIPRTNGYW